MGPWDPSQPVRVAISLNLPHRMVQMDGYGAGNDLGSFNLSILSMFMGFEVSRVPSKDFLFVCLELNQIGVATSFKR